MRVRRFSIRASYTLEKNAQPLSCCIGSSIAGFRKLLLDELLFIPEISSALIASLIQLTPLEVFGEPIEIWTKASNLYRQI